MTDQEIKTFRERVTYNLAYLFKVVLAGVISLGVLGIFAALVAEQFPNRASVAWTCLQITGFGCVLYAIADAIVYTIKRRR